MIKPQKESKYGDIVASAVTLDRANKIRTSIKQQTVGLWVFVFRDAKDKDTFSVGVQNGWGGPLAKEELLKVTSLVNN